MGNDIRKIFEITDFIDTLRWNSHNDYAINYFKPTTEISNSVKMFSSNRLLNFSF
jgi:hypothetical protein